MKVVGKRERWRIGTVMGVEPRFWGCCMCIVDNQWAESPYGIIALAQGWPDIERR
jgi:hypothetical protein